MLEKTYDPKELESRLYAQWEASGSFQARGEEGKKPFVIMMPPPNVTGSLHMGHALNYTLQDVLIRYARMRGYDTLWLPGTDHAGIATQSVVERQLEAEGTTRQELGREAFLKRVWDWKETSGHAIVQQQRRLGASPDWTRQRFTLDDGLSKAVRHVFVQLYKDGLIYKDNRLVNWDPKLQTAVSDLEVQSHSQQGSFWYIKYPVVGDPSTFVTVATTRPETLFGDAAVAVHPEDPRYTHLHGKKLHLPLTSREIPLITDPHSDPEKGTGAVKITPAHDFDDFEVGKRHDLPLRVILDEKGFLTGETPPPFHGLERAEARVHVVKALGEKGFLEKVETKEMVVPYGERSGVVLEPRLTEQWFLEAKVLAEPAFKAVEEGRTRFVPDHWKATYFEWLKNIQPWCLSRQLWWGHQIPAWYGPDGEVFVALTEEDAHAQAEALYGKPVSLIQDPDVLDTWFSSALWPFSTLGWPEQTEDLKAYYPGDVLVTGFDIIFFWVARMMMMGLYFMKDVPFRTVYINALVRDEKGQKMSKSKGNVIDPLHLMDQYGSDALRFCMTSLAVPGVDLKFSNAQVEGYRNFCTKLWNAARFCEHHGCVLDPFFDPSSAKAEANQWILQRFFQCAQAVSDHLTHHRFDLASHTLYHFIWAEFCDGALEFSKTLLKAPQTDKETRQTLAWVLGNILHILHPFTPFITEELWQKLFKVSDLLSGREWPLLNPLPASFESSSQDIDWLIALISQLRTLKAEINIPMGTKLSLICVKGTEKTRERLNRLQALLEAEGRLSALLISPTEEDIPVQSVVSLIHEEATFLIPFSGILDLEKEKHRLTKKRAALDQDLISLRAKLENPHFAEKAPQDILEKTRARFEETQHMKEALSVLLEKFSLVSEKL